MAAQCRARRAPLTDGAGNCVATQVCDAWQGQTRVCPCAHGDECPGRAPGRRGRRPRRASRTRQIQIVVAREAIAS